MMPCESVNISHHWPPRSSAPPPAGQLPFTGVKRIIVSLAAHTQELASQLGKGGVFIGPNLHDLAPC